ncbi:MAG: stage II sporulation protein R [bacterium]|nr:stage II sporulation protein R [bacterium]
MNSKRLLANCTLLSLSSLLLLATWAQSRQEALSGKLIRLHVLAESDSEEDQAKKLCARDAVLALLTPELEGVKSREEAETVIRRLTPAISLAAEKAAGTQAAVQLSREYYPTRRYGTFSLPAGQYFSLRVTLGQGLGHNWWCVVYPPLCAQSAQESLAGAAILSEEDARLLAEDGESYVFRFRLLELWGELREKLEG